MWPTMIFTLSRLKKRSGNISLKKKKLYMQPTVFFFLFYPSAPPNTPFSYKQTEIYKCKHLQSDEAWEVSAHGVIFWQRCNKNGSTISALTWMLPQLRHCNYQFLSLLLSGGTVLKLQHGRLKIFPNEAEGFFLSDLLRTTCSSGDSVATGAQRGKKSALC